LNLPKELPVDFDKFCLTWDRMLAKDIPQVTMDCTTGQYFSMDVGDDDVARVKTHICKTGAESSHGADGVDYDLILEIPNEDLVKLCNKCLNYHIICLESCLLKVLTMIIHQHMSTWAVDKKIIPEWQNGFCVGYHILNNAFIYDMARESNPTHHKPLFMAFVDATNAFPSTNQDTLWLCLIDLGMGNPMFDWLRFVY
ncbi:hypothetical protein ARMGADRAFT_934094, partial [Armillaria gallica]